MDILKQLPQQTTACHQTRYLWRLLTDLEILNKSALNLFEDNFLHKITVMPCVGHLNSLGINITDSQLYKYIKTIIREVLIRQKAAKITKKFFKKQVLLYIAFIPMKMLYKSCSLLSLVCLFSVFTIFFPSTCRKYIEISSIGLKIEEEKTTPKISYYSCQRCQGALQSFFYSSSRRLE